MRKYEACFSKDVGIGNAVADLVKAGIKFQYKGVSDMMHFHMLVFETKLNEGQTIDMFVSGKPWRLLRFSTSGGPHHNISLRDRGVEAPVESTLKTYILIDHDEQRVFMLRAKDEDDLPDIYYKVLCEEEADPDEWPDRDFHDSKFVDDTIKVECSTYYEKEQQTVVQLFDW